VRPYCSA